MYKAQWPAFAIVVVFVLWLHGVLFYGFLNQSPISNSLSFTEPNRTIIHRLSISLSNASTPTEIPSPSAKVITTKRERLKLPSALAPIIRQATLETTEPSLISSVKLYLTADQLDQSATPLADLGTVFAKIFPVLSGIVVIELWIDDEGNTTDAILIQGKPIDLEGFWKEDLLQIQFLPAKKNGQNVHSKQLIEINTDTAFIF
jgi:hypothetical protein